MAKYKHSDIENGQGLFLTVNLKEQLLPGTFEHMLNDLIGKRIDISVFDKNYKNDETGAKAIPPSVLIKLIIYGYSKGIKSSRKLSELCARNIIAKALAEGMEPHWTTIADFISSNSEIFREIFVKVLAYCAGLKLIGGETFAIDGLRLPSNASISLSGTKKELEKRLELYQRMAEKHITKHKSQDERGELDSVSEERYQTRQKKLNRQIEKIDGFLENMEKKAGKKGKEIKSNVTDNESAMIKTGSGFIQGYIGLAVSDKRNQIIVSADAAGNTNEGEYLAQMLDDTLRNMKDVDVKPAEGKKRIMMGDGNYYSEENLKACQDMNIEAIIPDNYARRGVDTIGEKRYEVVDFKYCEEGNYYECPNGKKLEYKRINMLSGREGKLYQANVKDCRICPLSARCIKSKKEIRKIDNGRKIFITHSNEPGSLCAVMREKLKTVEYQDHYSYRIQIVEPVFANIKHCKGLNRFTLRGKNKVSGQWNLFCIVHNLWKCLKGYNESMGYT